MSLDYEELIVGVKPKILEKEIVYGDYRPTKLEYNTTMGVVVCYIEYTNSANSASWAEIKQKKYEQRV